ncbi:helix-turn-helix domain-containing protein [Sphaerospermopsis torques-reginae]
MWFIYLKIAVNKTQEILMAKHAGIARITYTKA